MAEELSTAFPIYGIYQSPFGNISLNNTRDLLDSTMHKAQQGNIKQDFISKSLDVSQGLKQFESKVQEKPQLTSEIATKLPRSVVGGKTQGVSQLFAIKKKRTSKYT